MQVNLRRSCGDDREIEWPRDVPCPLASSLRRIARGIHVIDQPQTCLPSYSPTRDGNIWQIAFPFYARRLNRAAPRLCVMPMTSSWSMSTAPRIPLNRPNGASSVRQDRRHRGLCANMVRGAAQHPESVQLTYSAVHIRARRMMRQYGIGLRIIGDLLWLRVTDDSLHAHQNRALETSEITRGLQSMAKDLNIPCRPSRSSPLMSKSARINARSFRMSMSSVQCMNSAIRTLRYSCIHAS